MTKLKTTLATVAATLPHPAHPLLGQRPGPLVLPDNIICFQRRTASELNRPQRGRALHHRFVLIFALHGRGVSVCVDDRIIPLNPGEGLLVFPFQFHHYLDAGQKDLFWIFVTFDLTDAAPLKDLPYRPFLLSPAARALAAELISAYQNEGRLSELPPLLLALLLARLRRQRSAPRRKPEPTGATDLVMRVNQLTHGAYEGLRLQEIARNLGISQSHLRARFRASCGVSIGRHLRRVRLERACGLLRLTPKRVSEIAEQCGFNSIYSFSRAFRADLGDSPSVYRQKMGRSGTATTKSRRRSRRPGHPAAGSG